MDKTLSIGTLASLTGCKVVTIRYYEQIGMVPEPGRSAGGHRVYDRHHFERLLFIRKARELGFPLESVRGLLALSERSDDAPCAEVDKMAAARLREVRTKIADLRAFEATLGHLLKQCGQTTIDECRILDAFRGGPVSAEI